MFEEKRYPVSREYLLNLICDIKELQKGKDMKSDTTQGNISFSTVMYGFRYEFHFTVTPDENDTLLRLETGGSTDNDRQRIRQMLALLESLMKQCSTE